jgi:hypothetical protein
MSDPHRPNLIDPSPQRNPGAGPGDAPKDFRLGVLLVHGIGTQPARDTLVRWDDVLLKLIGRATKNQVILTLRRASPGDRSGEKPAEVAVDFRAGDQKEKWLLAEGWWADSFPAPTYAELVSWSVRAVPWSIAVHIAQRYWQPDRQASGKAKLIALANAVVHLLVALALAPVFIALLALVLLLGLVPIPQLRSLILSAQSTITGTVGDSLAFVESPLRAALIRTRIFEGLNRLQARCERTVIVAHSQGAAAALDALGGITQAVDPEEATSPEPPPGGPVPDTLVTFGSGINQLVSLKVLSAGLPEKIGMNPASFAVSALLVMIGLLLFLYVSIRSGRTTVLGLVQAAGLWSVVLGSGVLLAWGAYRLIDKLAAQGKTGVNIKAWTMVLLMLAAIVAGIIYADIHDLPLGPVSFLCLALLVLVVSLSMILSSTMATVVTAPVQKPRGLARWVDLHASADPVTNGPTRIARAGVVESVPVWNQGSILSDHTTYWDNLDGFVLRVARVCAETAESPWQAELPPTTPLADRRAAWRVDLLRWARRLNTLLWLFAFVLLWTRHRARVPLPFELPSWFPAGAPTAARFAVLVVLVAVAAWATSALLRWPWSRWVRAEQEQVLAHAPPTPTPLAPLIGMGMVISLLVLLAGALARGDASMARELLADPGEWFSPLMLMFGGGVILAAIAYWLRPAPLPPDTTVTHTGKR